MVRWDDEKYGDITQQRLSVPICMNHKLLLIPMKMRKPKFPKDGAYGYVNLHDIKDINENEKNTIIKLKNEQEILCLQRIRTVKGHINKAKIVASDVQKGEKEVHEFYTQYSNPATRGDIARLQREILELRDLLKSVLVPSKK